MENSLATRPASIRWNHFAGITLLSFATLMLDLPAPRTLCSKLVSFWFFGDIDRPPWIWSFRGCSFTLEKFAR